MWSSTVVSVLLAIQVLAVHVAAHGFDWVNHLADDCWQDCLGKTSDGCDSQKCICDASQSDTYLTSAIRCTKAKCDADGLALSMAFLGPLALYCAASGDDIPASVMQNAYAAATATATTTTASSTRKPQYTTASDHKTTHGGLRSTVRTTYTQTTTDEDGHTVEVVVPIVMGPNTLITGDVTTKTLSASSTTTPGSSSTAAPSSESAGSSPSSSSSAPTQAQGASSSSTTAQATQRTSNSNGNGSPFENMQAGAAHLGISGAVIGLGAVAGIFMRL